MLTREYLDKLIEVNPFSVLCKMEITEFGEDFVVGRMPCVRDYQNPYGAMHGGSLYALADTVGGISAVNNTGSFVTTLDGHLNYLRAAMNTEYIYCRSDVLRAGGRIVVTDLSIYGDDGKVFCKGDFNYYRVQPIKEISEL